ncbi:oligosaccharide flippase family protein [Staphylococcus hominis]|uniref:Oligosaccharide flippase family protein n=1 Tax=Staphylococcus hominis TaxID=1290 RepID=A0A6N0I2I8_STAHO|nr:oligosaccharide flippase family protein [Staphylococcus hominis]
MSRLKNIGYTFIGNVTFSMIKWLILILIVKLTTPEQVGNYTFAMALTAPIILFTNMRLRLRYVVEDNLIFNNVRILRNVLNVFSILIILVVGAILFPQYLSYIILVAFTKILDLQSELYYAILHKKQNFKLISLMQIGKSIVIIIPFIVVTYFTKNVIYGLFEQILIQFLWLQFFEKRAIKYKEHEIDNYNKRLIFNIFLTGLPLGFVQMINSYNIMIPRYVIEGILSVKMVGVFASISYLLTIVDLFMNAISQNIIIKIKNFIQNKEYKKLTKYINRDVFLYSIVLGVIVIIPVYFLKDFIIGLLYGEFYRQFSNVLLIIVISIIFNFQSWMFDTTLMAFKAYRMQLVVSIPTMVVSIIASFILVHLFGIIGASLSVVLINCTQAIIKYIIIKILIKRATLNLETD